MFKTLIKHQTITVSIASAVLGAVAVFQYSRHMELFRSNAQELADLDAKMEKHKALMERRKVLKDKLDQAAQDYWAMKKEYVNFFSGNPYLPEYYKYMWQDILPEAVALHNFMHYAHKELLRLEDGEVFEEAEAQEYLMIVAAVRKTFDRAVSAAKAAVENKNGQKEAKLSEDEKIGARITQFND